MHSKDKDKDKKILHFHFCGTGERVSDYAERLANKGEYLELSEFQATIYKEKIQLENDIKELKEALQTKQLEQNKLPGFEQELNIKSREELSNKIKENENNLEEKIRVSKNIMNFLDAIEHSNDTQIIAIQVI